MPAYQCRQPLGYRHRCWQRRVAEPQQAQLEIAPGEAREMGRQGLPDLAGFTKIAGQNEVEIVADRSTPHVGEVIQLRCPTGKKSTIASFLSILFAFQASRLDWPPLTLRWELVAKVHVTCPPTPMTVPP